uniref:Uncharacterized protein n=1 Tax=Caenorhabditis japonica TaxID=281687 RepID=A0A8R1IBC3_CAEJA
MRLSLFFDSRASERRQMRSTTVKASANSHFLVYITRLGPKSAANSRKFPTDEKIQAINEESRFVLTTRRRLTIKGGEKTNRKSDQLLEVKEKKKTPSDDVKVQMEWISEGGR